ncbi:MAG TPA: N-acetyltransferase [Pseudomonadales bacterium]|nr:N-acetyltransferase [Pseudomonadales bacterium]
MIGLRDEHRSDAPYLRKIVREAFDRDTEARIVDLARQRHEVIYSIVAEIDGKLVGHVLVTPMKLEPDKGLRCIAIGPIAVTPEHQGNGIGSKLMQEVIERAREDGVDAILLLGNPRYYHRFGFRTAPVGNEYGAGEEFMALQLNAGCLDSIGGTCMARYIKAFSEAESS